MKKTMVIGATTNPERYAYRAVLSLTKHGHEVVPVGVKTGVVGGIPILQGQPNILDIDTISLYIGPDRQQAYCDYLLGLHPKRIIFNPGTENPVLAKQAEEQGIETVEGCTLVILSIGNY
ncbi:MAG: hypothetical protein RIQ78_1195 [Bacteroidota bacterium]|jgi:predicted CoA-binding protein